MGKKIELQQLKPGNKEFTLGKEGIDEGIPDKIRIDPETIMILDDIEEKKIVRFTLINNLWTKVTSLEEEQEASLGHITIQVIKIQQEKATFLLK